MLLQNWGATAGVVALQVACGASRGSEEYGFDERRGTGSACPTSGGLRLERRTVDDLVEEFFPDGLEWLKVDTDGHDFEVLRGASATLERFRPAVLFECDSFGRAEYVDDCMAALEGFRERGYAGFLVYDNFGHLIGRYMLDRADEFVKLLFFQLTSPFHYFDLLVMKEEDLCAFHAREVEYFAGRLPDPLRRAAQAAASSGSSCPRDASPT